jgi:microcin C transport system permease protein
VVPAARPDQRQLGACRWGKITDYLWHITLPVTAQLISAFATLTLLTKNSFLDEIKKQYVMTARAKGLSEGVILYGHVFRNAMLIVIAGFPGLFLGVFFGSSLMIEMIFSLDGLGQLGFSSAVETRLCGDLRHAFAFGLIGLVVGILSDLMYVFVDPRIDFERRG